MKIIKLLIVSVIISVSGIALAHGSIISKVEEGTDDSIVDYFIELFK